MENFPQIKRQSSHTRSRNLLSKDLTPKLTLFKYTKQKPNSPRTPIIHTGNHTANSSAKVLMPARISPVQKKRLKSFSKRHQISQKKSEIPIPGPSENLEKPYHRNRKTSDFLRNPSFQSALNIYSIRKKRNHSNEIGFSKISALKANYKSFHHQSKALLSALEKTIFNSPD